ncbi:T9SS-dependent choice-of-anchor J family protein [Flaviaesturariibacter aridisoli]|uniref:T9SS type A sorting domain-containing protein n=1 Tax=Flaviaesturariibacter aridisoli TaxID=2545761 RepID=A0A4R4E8P1_9BACT|nr:choice-of-anchor J domain-containing protein [Flaviaesturariibacter aridisoli]TCZ74168.1 T9SS type A sorting domain-containing protein [Flaviaesturariibacter aridisoli]
MEAIEERLHADPAFRAEWERNQRAGVAPGTARTNATLRTTTLTGPVTIPVVVHVVLPDPNQITEAQVDYFLDRLNLDFSGLNPDSANAGTAFMPLRGHSLIRFTRARRTPSGQLTNGLERRVGSVQIGTTTYQAIKHASAGGLDPWDVTKYYNLWVGIGAGGLLGIAPNIGPGNATETTGSSIGIDGVCVDYRGFSNGCFSFPEFNLARTAVHEIGHNFGLYHSFTGCAAGADFAQITPNFADASLYGAAADDTPGQSTATSGCLTGIVASNCAGVPNPPGKMYQNYMDYTDDRCYSMFTIGQVRRMHAVLELMRPGYLTTDGATPPAGTLALDVTPTALIAPGGSEFNNTTCASTTYPTPTCAGAVVPRVMVTNAGTSTITSVTVTVSNNGGAPVSTTVTGLNILTGYGASVALPSINLVTGTNTLVFTVSNPNGSADQNAANNTFTTSVVINGGSAPPLTENFVSTTFPPANWTIFNPNGNFTWQRSATGNGNAGSMFFDNFNNSAGGQIDELRSMPVSVAPTDQISVAFDVAYRPYSLTTNPDTFAVLVSNDCGVNWTEIYKKWGVNLATVAGTITATGYVPTGAADWRRENITLSPALLNGGNIQVAFRSRGRFGQNVYVDNINVSKVVARDLALTTLVAPGTQSCGRTITPQITVRNNGVETVTAFNVNYSIDGGTLTTQTITAPLAAGASTTLTFATPTTVGSTGNHTIAAYTSDPITAGGIGDLTPANDTVRRTFNIINLAATPLVEGFEGASFPPPGWTISNPNGDMTWEARSPGRNSLKSMFIDNWNNTDGRLDEIRLPALNIAGADSVAISFDVAYKAYTGSPDTLGVYASADCGNSFTAVYKKQGTTLATAGTATTEYTAPASGDWRRERTLISSPAQLASGNMILYFRNTSRFGNNLFVDNVNVEPYFGRDLSIVSALPAFTICEPATTPSVVVRNEGTQTITSFKVAYSINNGTPLVQTVNTNLAPSSTMTVTLAGATFPAAATTPFKVWVADPVSASGTGDARRSNDTLNRTVTVASKVNAPLVENFSASSATSFPPSGWTVVNSDNATTWTWSVAGNGNAGSALLNSFNYTGTGHEDGLVTPVVQYSGADSVTLAFDVAAGSRLYPGSTVQSLDTLEVLATADCGATYQSVYKKWGQELQTVLENAAANFPQGTGFAPNATQWRSERVDVSGFTTQPQVQFLFRARSNNGNNIYIDNVNVSARTLPANLKANGYVITPNPTSGNTFRIWHLRQPTTLRYVNVYDAKGALVWTKSYSKNAENVITVDLSGKPAGVYMVSLGYDDDYRNVTERVIKQ